MESIFLFIIILIEAGIIAYQNHNQKKIVEDSMDRLAQKNAGVYYPTNDKTRKAFEEQDKVDLMPLEDVSDEEFLKAVRKGVDQDAK